MTKILLIGDLHLRDKPPANATETYVDDLFDLLKWVFEAGKKLEVDAVVFAGDVFDFKQPARTSHALLVRFSTLVMNSGLDVYSIVGNHDITGDRLDSLPKQPLGVLFASGVMKELRGWHETLPICGVPWQQRWLNPGVIEEALSVFRKRSKHYGAAYEKMESKNSLLITHAPIYPPAIAENVMFELLPLPEVSSAMGNEGYLYYGHIHEDHGVFEVDGVTYCNSGALSRGSLTEYNINRDVKVTLWSPEKGFQPFKVPAKPADEVFKMVEAQEKKKEKMSLDTFLTEVGNATLDISSTSSIIDHVKLMDIEKNVKDKSIQLLEEVSD